MPDPRANPFTPLKVGPLTLKNRFVKVATNEGMCKGGIISKGLARFHENIAKGGAALTTVAYCATSHDGRTFVDQARLGGDTVKDFKALTDGVHRHNAAACAQITHAGCFTFLPKGVSAPRPLSASGGFNKCGVMTKRFTKRKMTRADMDIVAREFVTAAQYAREAGFDAVEIHMGHGYLLSQFISPFYNKRRDAYGGALENRMAFPAEVLSKVLDAVGRDLAVIVKYSQTDGRAGGNSIEDGKAIARILEARGAHMAVLSNGMNVESVSAMFGSSLPAEIRQPPKNPIIRMGLEWQKISEFRTVEFTELYLMDLAQQIRAATTMPLCYLGGVKSIGNVQQALDNGFDTIGLGRALIHNPGLVNGFESGRLEMSGCTACNQCVTMMYSPGGTSCSEPGGRPGHDPSLNTVPAASAAP